MLTLHIGPPKTATSSLQDAIQNLPSEHVRYLGITQPRIEFTKIIEDPNKHLAEVIYLRCAYPDIDLGSVDLCAEMQRETSSGKTVWLSEEMFLTDHPQGVKWQTKIMRLGKLLRNLSSIPLVTIRNPLNATQSLYRELFPSLPKLSQQFPSAFAYSNAPKVYDYRYLLKVLQGAGFERVRIIDFDELCVGKVSQMALLGNNSTELIPIPHRNKASDHTTSLRRSRRLSHPPCSWLIDRRIKYYRSLKKQLGENNINEYQILQLLSQI